MYFCYDCLKEFEEPKKIIEKHGQSSPPYETSYVCPYCYSYYFTNKIHTHCRSCGAKLTKGKTDYCSKECAESGRALWEKQMQHRRAQLISPLNILIRELGIYNETHNTNYSYGQYVAMLENERAKKKCAKKKKNI